MLQEKKVILWLVLQYKPKKNETWNHEVQGIFSTKEKAIKACRDRNYSYMPLELNKSLPHRTTKHTNVYPIED